MNWFINLMVIAVGGAAGAVSRFLFSSFIHLFFDKGFPTGILLTNILGSFLMGYLSILLFERLPHVVELRSFLLIGFLGAFTTFSTFSLDTMNLLEAGHWVLAGLNVILSVVICVVAAGIGIYFAKMIG